MTKAETQLDDFTRGYITAALWSSTDDDGDPLDANYSIDDLAPETLARMVADCERFQRQFCLRLPVYEAAREHGEWSGDELAGHDFWLTRCGHGTGFWDRFHARSKALERDTPERKEAVCARIGDYLTARVGYGTDYPNIDLYVGDDGRIYAN